jgi:hypothetical protein
MAGCLTIKRLDFTPFSGSQKHTYGLISVIYQSHNTPKLNFKTINTLLYEHHWYIPMAAREIKKMCACWWGGGGHFVIMYYAGGHV